MSHYFLCSQNKDSIIYGFFQLLAAKQNQKFPFHFLSAPPTPPAERNKKGRKIFGFCPRESASAPEAQSERTIEFQATTRSARATLVGVLLEMGSDFFKQTPQTKQNPRVGFLFWLRTELERERGRENILFSRGGRIGKTVGFPGVLVLYGPQF